MHILDDHGARLNLSLPITQLPVPSSLFLATANGIAEWGQYVEKKGLTVGGVHHPDVKSASRLVDPETFLSKFIHIDVQSSTELGEIGNNENALGDIVARYGGGKVLFDPQGYYDRPKENSVQHLKNKELPAYATLTAKEWVTPDELKLRAQTAAKVSLVVCSQCDCIIESICTIATQENNENTPYCATGEKVGGI